MGSKAITKATGRPRKVLDWPMIADLCKIHCTQEEISDIVKCSIDTLDRASIRDNGEPFAAFYKKHTHEGKKSLRRAMFGKALGVRDGDPQSLTYKQWLEKPDTTMQIWLSKQHLNMKDKNDVTNTILDADKIVFKISWQDDESDRPERDRAEDAPTDAPTKVAPPI